jgi:DMSO/TMAO reductase YedYZ molybdopterin-dependent catalytic subunit
MSGMSRRKALVGGAGSLLVAGCDALNRNPTVRGLLEQANDLHLPAQRLLAGRDKLAREFSVADMSPVFRANGSRTVEDAAYRAHLNQDFANWTLRVDGLVKRALDLPLTALKAMAQRTQITRHDCVEGWSAIGQWQGPQLGTVLARAGLMPAARYAVFHCADTMSGGPYYESIDLIDAFHPQTILAWRMNGQPLPLAHGAPIRLRVERQLGYKHAKFVMRIELVESLVGLHGGKGGYWEDRGYQWYAGI